MTISAKTAELIMIIILALTCVEVLSFINDINRPFRLSQRSYFKVEEEISFFEF